MSEHLWGDDTFDWKALNDAGEYIYSYCLRRARIGIHWKEKWGCLRVSPWFFDGTLHSLLYPGHVFVQEWYWFYKHIDLTIIKSFFRYTGLIKLIRKWQCYIYRKAYVNAVKKWPHIKAEILQDASHSNLIPEYEKYIKSFWTYEEKSND